MASRGDSPDHKRSGSGHPGKPPTKKAKRTLGTEEDFRTDASSFSQSEVQAPSLTPQAILSALGELNVVPDRFYHPQMFFRQPIIKGSARQSWQSPDGCIVGDCPSNTIKTDGLWLFEFPCPLKETSLRAAWVERVPIDPEARPPHLCFRHFSRDDLVYQGHRVVGIKTNALPSVNLPTQVTGEPSRFTANKRCKKTYSLRSRKRQ